MRHVLNAGFCCSANVRFRKSGFEIRKFCFEYLTLKSRNHVLNKTACRVGIIAISSFID